MQDQTTQVGSTQRWIASRIFDLLAIALLTAAIWRTVLERRLDLFWIACALAGAFVWTGLDSIVYGTADESGIRYRRYFRSKFIPWREICMAEWQLPNVVWIFLKSGPFLRRQLKFVEDFSWREFGGMLAGSESPEPKFIRWLWLAKPAEADEIVICRSQSGWDKKDHTTLAIALLIACAVALLLSHYQ